MFCGIIALVASACAEIEKPPKPGLCGIAAGLVGASVGGGIGAGIAVAASGHGGASAGTVAGATAGGAVLGAALGSLFARNYCDRPVTAVAAPMPPAPARAPSPPPPPVVASVSAPPREKLVLRGVHFDSANWNISGADKAILDEAVETLNAHPSLRIYVDGYTDDRGSGPENLRLAERRAQTVAEYLHAHGVPVRQILARGLGMTTYLASNATPEGRAQNRRVELLPSE